MKKNQVIAPKQSIVFDSKSSFAYALVASVMNLVSVLMTPVEWLRGYYSSCLERDLSMKQTWLLLYAQVTFVGTAFCCGGSMVARIVLFGLMVHALLLCKEHL